MALPPNDNVNYGRAIAEPDRHPAAEALEGAAGADRRSVLQERPAEPERVAGRRRRPGRARYTVPGTVKKALRTYTRDFIAILVLGAIGLLALFVILSQQSTALPSWFPFLGEDRFELKTEFQTAQAVTPGQGQTVNLSGVEIGDVTSVDLENGVAVVTMQVDPEFAQLIHPDASALLRPRTGLQDMTIELDAGTEQGEIPEGYTIPLANSEPNVNPDQILASLDGDTRAYLRLLLAGGAAGVRLDARRARTSRRSCAGSTRPCATSRRSTERSPSAARTSAT